jgi:tetratricopeptide (TPR) repeat protein
VTAEGGPGVAGADRWIGRTIAGQYRVEALVGSGAMGVVYRATHALLPGTYAVKVLSPDLVGDPEARRRFLVEALSLSRVVHGNVVPVRHVGEEEGHVFLVMDFCAGETLAALLDREGPLAEARAARIAVDVLEGLEAAHEEGVVHRDLKPANVIVERTRSSGGSERERARVVDFGLARLVGSGSSVLPSSLRSAAGSVVGTVSYMSPEQLRDDQPLDGRSDLFSVGVVLYQVLSGNLPFRGDSTISVAMRILSNPPDPWPEPPPAPASPGMRAVVERALAKSPDERWQTAGEMAEALRAVLAGNAPPPAPPRRAPGRRTPLSVRTKAALALAGVGLASVGAWAVVRGVSDPRGTAREALRAGRYAEAEGAFTTLVERGEATAEDVVGRALARVRLGRQGTVADFEDAAARSPKDANVLVEKARYLWRWRRAADAARAAEETLGQALLRDADSIDAYAERARLRLSVDRLADAEQDVEQVRRRAPDDARASFIAGEVEIHRARAEADAGRRVEAYRRAAGHGEKAEAADPRWAEATELRGRAAHQLGLEARYRGDVATARQHLFEAVAHAGRAIDRIRGDPLHRGQDAALLDIQVRRLDSRFHLGDTEGMAEDVRLLEERFPEDDARARRQIAWAFLNLRLYADAERLYDRLSNAFREPWDTTYLGYARMEQGRARARAGDRRAAIARYEAAAEAFREAARRDPPRLDAHFYLGEVLTLSAQAAPAGDRSRYLGAAQAALDATRESDGVVRHWEALVRLAELRRVVGDVPGALDAIRRCVGAGLDGTARCFVRFAECLLDAAGLEGDPVARRALLAEAVAAATKAAERARAKGLVARAAARLALARTEPEGETRGEVVRDALADLDGAERSLDGPEPHPDDLVSRSEPAWLAAEAHLLAGDATAAVEAARRAVARREDERRAGRWAESDALFERLAEALDRAGRADEAAAAREEAARVRREAEAAAGG